MYLPVTAVLKMTHVRAHQTREDTHSKTIGEHTIFCCLHMLKNIQMHSCLLQKQT